MTVLQPGQDLSCCGALQEVQQAAAGMARAAMLSQYQREADADEVDLELILALLRHLCQGSEGRLGATSKGTHGAVLVFLPGGQLAGYGCITLGSCMQGLCSKACAGVPDASTESESCMAVHVLSQMAVSAWLCAV